jgi:hypothetical protein
MELERGFVSRERTIAAGGTLNRRVLSIMIADDTSNVRINMKVLVKKGKPNPVARLTLEIVRTRPHAFV